MSTLPEFTDIFFSQRVVEIKRQIVALRAQLLWPCPNISKVGIDLNNEQHEREHEQDFQSYCKPTPLHSVDDVADTLRRWKDSPIGRRKCS